MKTSPKILITRCYSEVTPESAEDGEASDSGLVYENEPFTFSELVREIENGYFQREGATEWLTVHQGIIDYATCTEREESLHFSHLNSESARKWFELAVCFATRKANR